MAKGASSAGGISGRPASGKTASGTVTAGAAKAAIAKEQKLAQQAGGNGSASNTEELRQASKAAIRAEAALEPRHQSAPQDDFQKANDWGARVYAGWQNRLSQAERASLSSYTEDSNYINVDLRHYLKARKVDSSAISRPIRLRLRCYCRGRPSFGS